VPIPAPGVQLVTLSHVEDVAAMLAAVPGNPAAVRQYYNVCSDRQISFVGACGGMVVCVCVCVCGTCALMQQQAVSHTAAAGACGLRHKDGQRA
jgi:hypothetical protein